MRLDKFISQNLGITCKETKQLLRQDLIEVDGSSHCAANQQVDENNHITFRGRTLFTPGPLYFMLNKPEGYICATKDNRYPTVLDLLDEPRVQTLHPVGRLDIDTTGLVLLTNDGQWSHGITSPKRHKVKCYRAHLAEPLIEGVEKKFATGIMLKGEKRRTLPAQLKRITPTEVELAIAEGRYHQVKRMFAAMENAVTTLHRISIGPLHLDSELPEGHYRALNSHEIESLR
ncbi:MAG: pseudouridine synthase [Gammaproteobacteria bacterium]|nr:pseudouridine synthase [Gammaproteobacteria bacterium]MCF6231464.1 pseudouridine synthase [Gammaproteobacteria bacterium]